MVRRQRATRWRTAGVSTSPIAIAALTALGFLLPGVVGAGAYFLPLFVTAAKQTSQRPTPAATATAVAPGSPFTILLLGSDNDTKFPKDKVLTQSMILVRVNPTTHAVTMLSIPRDLWVPLSTGHSAKIDLAYQEGGAKAAIDTVAANFKVKIDDYAWIGLKGLVQLIDSVGGIDVVTTNPVLDDFYPSDLTGGHPYGFQRVAVLAGPQHLDGATALKYVRSRHGDLIGDYGRSQRQQQVLLAIRQKAKQLSPTDVPDLAAAFNGELKTSMGVARVRELLPLAAGLTNQDSIKQIVLLEPYTSLGTVDSQSVVLANWGLIRPLVAQYFR